MSNGINEKKNSNKSYTCHTFDGNPIIDTYTGVELAEDVLAIGSKPVVLVSQLRFLFTCIRSFIMTHLCQRNYRYSTVVTVSSKKIPFNYS